jgi:polyisoprenoid-binding protein YceI
MIRKLLIGMVLGSFAVTAGAHIYTLDKSHADVSFKVRHLGLSKVKGEFKNFEAKVGLEGGVETLTLEVTIDAGSVDTGNEKRDKHLLDADFFHVEEHPTITFKSTGVKTDGDVPVLVGDLTIKGVTKSIEFPVEVNGPIDSPFQEGMILVGLSFGGELARHDFDIKAGKADMAIGKTVYFEVSLEAQAAK